MTSYKIPLPNKGINTKNVTFSHLMASFLIIIMGAVTCMMIAVLGETPIITDNKYILQVAGIIYILIGIILLLVTIFANKKVILRQNSQKLRLLELIILAPVLIFSVIQGWNMPAIYAAVGIIGIIYANYSEKKGQIPKDVILDKEGVTLPNTKVGFLKWEEIKRLIIRHRILTVDCRNNKLFQIDIDENSNHLNVQEIEDFAIQLINESNIKKTQDW